MSGSDESWATTFEQIDESICLSGSDLVSRHGFTALSCGCKPSSGNGQATCRDFRCANYSTQTECVNCNPFCINNNFQKRKFKKVEVKQSGRKGFGVFAAQPIEAGAFIIEFTGEIISKEDFESRSRGNTENKELHMYIIQLKSKTFVDCRRKGSIARFINHSCEPNCRLEVWRVGNKLRVGVFSLESILLGEELSFDYQWEPSSELPPTKCYCGQWVHNRDRSIDSFGENESIFNFEGKLIPEKLIGKRVRVWDESSMAYLEAKVVKRVDANRFSVHSTRDDDEWEVQIFDNGNWYWFDDCKALSLIKKRDSNVLPEVEEVVEVEGISGKGESDLLPSSSVKLNRVECSFIVDRELFKIRRSLAEMLLSTSMLEDANTLHLASSSNSIEGVVQSAPCLPQDFIGYVQKEFNLRVNLLRTIHPSVLPFHFMSMLDNTSSKSGYDSSDCSNEVFEIEAFGEKYQLQSLRRIIILAEDSLKLADSERQQHTIRHFRSRQSVLFTYDWRMISSINFVGEGDLKARKKLSTMLENVPESLINRMLGLKSLSLLSDLYHEEHLDGKDRAVNSKAMSSLVSRQVQRQLLNNIRCVCSRLNFPKMVCLHALAILCRFFRFVDDSVVKDSTVVISAMICLALKASNQFKFRLVPKIICSTYCTVFSRSEKDVGKSTESFLPKMFLREQEVYAKIGFDIFVPSIEPILIGLSLQTPSVSKDIFADALDMSSALLEEVIVNYNDIISIFTWDAIHLFCLFAVLSAAIHTKRWSNFDESAFVKVVLLCAVRFDVPAESLCWGARFVLCIIGLNVSILKGIALFDGMVFDAEVNDLIELCSKLISSKVSGHPVLSTHIDVKTPIVAKEVFQDSKCRQRNQLNTAVASNSCEPNSSKQSEENGELKTRLPTLCVNDLFERLALNTDTMIGVSKNAASMTVNRAQLAASHLDFLLDKSYLNHDIDGQLPFTVRALPLRREAKRELGKARSLKYEEYSIVAQEIAELQAIQQLHYLNSFAYQENENDGARMRPDGFQHIIQPFHVSDFNHRNSESENGVRSFESKMKDTRAWQASEPDQNDESDGDEADAGRAFMHTRVLCFQSVHITLHDYLKTKINQTHPLFAVDLCRQLLLGMDYLINCEGKLIIGCLAGASMNSWGTPQSDSKQQDKVKTHHKKTHACDDEETFKEIPKTAPKHCLHMVAPEVLLGGSASPFSVTYIAGLVCCLILTGRPLLKNGETEKRQVEYIFRTLGTPKAMHYRGFYDLPFSSACLDKLQKEDGSLTESRSRVFKVMKSLCPPLLQELFNDQRSSGEI
eukprot:scaffold1091_cov164-Ochromonas_danica.AAC.69